MEKGKKPKPDDREQSQRFVETAKSLGVDESGKAFDRAVRAVVAPKPKAVRSRPSGKRS